MLTNAKGFRCLFPAAGLSVHASAQRALNPGAEKYMRLATGFLTVLLLTNTGTLAGAEMRGLLVLGQEARSLQLCGDTRVFWQGA